MILPFVFGLQLFVALFLDQCPIDLGLLLEVHVQAKVNWLSVKGELDGVVRALGTPPS